MLAFLIIGGIGVVLVLISVIVGDVLGGALDGIGIGADWLTGAVAGFLGAFGFAGAFALGLSDSMVLATLIGLAAGFGFGATDDPSPPLIPATQATLHSSSRLAPATGCADRDRGCKSRGPDGGLAQV